MSERYGKCRGCKGIGFVMKMDAVLFTSVKKECGRCEGTGFETSADAYQEQEEKRDSA